MAGVGLLIDRVGIEMSGQDERNAQSMMAIIAANVVNIYLGIGTATFGTDSPGECHCKRQWQRRIQHERVP